jgi:major membrane immunogen (membrane-anchored lipoprotein)
MASKTPRLEVKVLNHRFVKGIVMNRIRLCVAAFLMAAVLPAGVASVPGTLDLESAFQQMERYVEINAIPNIRAVFDFFIRQVSAPTKAESLPDGTYSAESTVDNYHYKHAVTLRIKDGKFVSCDYDEIKTDGSSRKQSDSTYCAEMRKVTNTSPAEAYPVFEKSLIENQNLDQIHSVSGASYSYFRFKTTVIRSLMSGVSDSSN